MDWDFTNFRFDIFLMAGGMSIEDKGEVERFIWGFVGENEKDS